MENKKKEPWYKRKAALYGVIMGFIISSFWTKHDRAVEKYTSMYKLEALKMAYISHVSYLQVQRGYCYQAALELSKIIDESPRLVKKRNENERFLELIEKIDH